jgi:dTDP-4-amino-4,6-dideoxygalactose transaminase
MITLNNLERHHSSIKDEIEHAIDRVLNSGRYILGPEVESFEREFADYCSVSYCIGVGNGTDAIEIALRGLDIGQGDTVANVANAGFYSSSAILSVGAVPQYVDISWETMTMDPICLEQTITKSTKAIIVTHLYGQMADMPQIMEFAEKHEIPVIEDCAQAHGAVLNGKKAGSWGKLGCFSFYPTKNLGALGDGGVITTSDEKLAKKIRQLRQYGWGKKYEVDIPGGRNSRLDELQAAVLRAKLKHLDGWNNERRKIAARYTDELNRLDFVLPNNFGKDYVAHLYVVRTNNREELQNKLNNAGIATDVHYPIPDYKQKFFGGLNEEINLPNTEKCTKRVITLPCFPEMNEEELSNAIKKVMQAV